MYKAIEIQRETEERLHKLAKALIQDIIVKRIANGTMEEDPEGYYEFNPSDKELRINVWACDTYSPDYYLKRAAVKKICIGEEVYVVVGGYDEEVYLTTLPFSSIVDICCDIEDIWDEEVGE